MVQFLDIPRRNPAPTPASIVVRRSDGVPVSFPSSSPHQDAPKSSPSSNPIASFFSNVGRSINTAGRDLDWATSPGAQPGWVRPGDFQKLVGTMDPNRPGYRRPIVMDGVNGLPPVTDLNVPGIPSTQANRIPLTPDNQDLLVTEQTLKNKNDIYGMGYLHDLLQHPWTIPEKLFEALWKAGGYVLWTYQDFADQFRAWDGTWYGLITHMGLLWRAGVTALVTWGLWQSSGILEMLFGLLTELGRVLLDLVSWGTGATEFLFHWLGVLWDDTVGRLID